MQAHYSAVQHRKFGIIIGSLTKEMPRKSQVDLRKVEKRLDLVPYKDKENNLTMTSGFILVVVAYMEIK